MVARRTSPAVQRLGLNTMGRDWVVGDIHGCYDLLRRAMDRALFDPAVDRLLSVGDLINRGPTSREVVSFLAQPFVYACCGNHEDMLIELYQDGAPGRRLLEFFAKHNGFAWWLDTPERLREQVMEAVRRLPVAMELKTAKGIVGLVHADVPEGMSWPNFVASLEAADAQDVVKAALWGRTRIHSNNTAGVRGVSRVFVGHTPLSGPSVFGNVFAIDTGAVFGVLEKSRGGSISIVDARTPAEVIRMHGERAHPKDMVRVIAGDWPHDLDDEGFECHTSVAQMQA